MKMNKKGITLVEVIVVLIIMAVLAGILVASYTGYIDKAKDDKALVEARAAFLAASTIYHEAFAEGKGVTNGTGTWNLEDAANVAYYTEINKLAGVGGEIGKSITVTDNKITGMTYKVGDTTWTLTDGVWGK
jgi:prepilin-type N-terminal cleavage/methylation domain-containing protein